MKKFTMITLLTLMSANLLAAETGALLYQKNCASCHETGTGAQMLAPPMDGVLSHYRDQYPDHLELSKAISAWAINPEKERSLIPMALYRFGLMPKLNIPETDIDLIAQYLAARGDMADTRDSFKGGGAMGGMGRMGKMGSMM